jgi:hypothetical protein
MRFFYGRTDCQDNANNIGCEHPNVGVYSPFNANGITVGGRCTTNYIHRDSHKAILLIAAHCVNPILNAPRDHRGVSFDAKIEPQTGFDDSQFYTGEILVAEHPGFTEALFTVIGSEPKNANSTVDFHDVALLALPMTNELGVILDQIDNQFGGSEGAGAIPLPEQPLYIESNGYHNASASSKGGFTIVGYGLSEVITQAGDGGNSVPQDPTIGLFIRAIGDDTHYLGYLPPKLVSFEFLGWGAVNFIKIQSSPSGNHPGIWAGDSGGLLRDPKGVAFGIASTGFARGSPTQPIGGNAGGIYTRLDTEDNLGMIRYCGFDLNKTAEEVVDCVNNTEWRSQ